MSDQKESIVKQAYDQFKRFGFKNVTVDDIARVAGISKKTLYELFKDKDELVFDAVKYMIDSHQCHFDEATSSKMNAIEQLMRILTVMEDMIQGMNIICFVDLQRYYPQAYSFLEQHRKERMLRDIANNLKQGIAEGLYRESINVDIISAFRMESAFMIFQSSLYHNNYDILKVNQELFVHYMYGISSVKGHRLIEKYFNKLSNQ